MASFFVPFITIGIFWTSFHFLYEYKEVQRFDVAVNILTILSLFCCYYWLFGFNGLFPCCLRSPFNQMEQGHWRWQERNKGENSLYVGKVFGRVATWQVSKLRSVSSLSFLPLFREATALPPPNGSLVKPSDLDKPSRFEDTDEIRSRLRVREL